MIEPHFFKHISVEGSAFYQHGCYLLKTTWIVFLCLRASIKYHVVINLLHYRFFIFQAPGIPQLYIIGQQERRHASDHCPVQKVKMDGNP